MPSQARAMDLPSDAMHAVMDPELGQAAILIPQGSGRVRCYGSFPADGRRLSGAGHVGRFVQEAIRTGIRPDALAGAVAVGPLATFDCADTWVEHPCNDGIVLIGDGAAISDPTWGQGLSLATGEDRLPDTLMSGPDALPTR